VPFPGIIEEQSMPGSPPYSYLRFRRLLAGLSATFLIATLTITVYKAASTSLAEGLDDIPYNELTNESIKGRVEFSRSLFQVGLLVTAALWGLIIGKKDEAGIVLSDGPEIVMFISASALLVSSLIFHSIYLHYVSSIYALAGHVLSKTDPTIADVFNPNINNFYIFQIGYLVLGFIVAVVTLVSAHKLKEVL
jgi:hypothetical protein